MKPPSVPTAADKSIEVGAALEAAGQTRDSWSCDHVVLVDRTYPDDECRDYSLVRKSRSLDMALEVLLMGAYWNGYKLVYDDEPERPFEFLD